MRAASGGAYTYMRAAYMPHIRHVCGICAQARVYGMYAAYMRLPMPHAYMRLPPPPEYMRRRSHSSDACLGTDVLLRYLRVHHA
jgi:hypothetical protein